MLVTEQAHFTIRPFTIGEVDIYKGIRLEALQEAPGVYGNSYATELAFADSQWMNRVANLDGACFGLYDNTILIGVTSIIIDKEKPDEAYMTQSYIRKQYRGRGLSSMLYKARLEWADTRGLKRLVIGHRASNIASKAANQHFGFRYTHSEARTWPDGAVEDMLYYELLL